MHLTAACLAAVLTGSILAVPQLAVPQVGPDSSRPGASQAGASQPPYPLPLPAAPAQSPTLIAPATPPGPSTPLSSTRPSSQLDAGGDRARPDLNNVDNSSGNANNNGNGGSRNSPPQQGDDPRNDNKPQQGGRPAPSNNPPNGANSPDKQPPQKGGNPQASPDRWVVRNMRRTCDREDTRCQWTFSVDTGSVRGAIAECDFTVTTGGRNTRASRTDTSGNRCGPFVLRTGWSGQGGSDNGFTVLSVIDYDRKRIVWPGYTDAQLAAGQTVRPDQAYPVATLPDGARDPGKGN